MMGIIKKKEMIICGALFAVLLALSAVLLEGDRWVFWTWWLLILVMGILAMPLTGRLFRCYQDKGWVFSKVLSVAAAGYLEWLLVSMKAIPFSTLSCYLVVAVLAAVSVAFYLSQGKKGIECLPSGCWDLVLKEELLFFAAFLIWTYFMGFNPAAYGTEKFMDYGFMEAMMRSTSLPPKDIWYSQEPINYYYGGQYFAVFLTKLSTCPVARTYNLMRALIAGLTVAMPFSLVRQMLSDRLEHAKTSHNRLVRLAPDLGGLTAGIAMAFAGNMHYVWYGVIEPWIARLTGGEIKGYWFPDATRYIGYNPDVPDKTIHEFPCYSFILGDLHAHVVNIIFVLLIIGLLYAWLKVMNQQPAVGFTDLGEGTEDLPLEDITDDEHENVAARIAGWMSAEEEGRSGAGMWKKHLLDPWLLTAAFLLGLFKLNNFWDFVIYFVVVLGTALFINILEMKSRILKLLGVTLAEAAMLFGLSSLVILPFTVQFKTMVEGVALASNHSLPHQLLILWGLPVCLGLLFMIPLLVSELGKMKPRTLSRLIGKTEVPDLYAIWLFLCAFGLVLIPELVYVRDIYENGNARANTMFKLTYQAYILFAIMMGYVIWQIIFLGRKKLQKAAAAAGLFFLCWTLGYFGNCVRSWYGESVSPDFREGLDAQAFLDVSFSDDVEAIYWLKDHVKGSPVVLEANGDSYTDYQRVSAMTGLPTILGWYVHEWLWRSDPADLNEKSADVEAIYTSTDNELVSHLLKIYDVDYIFVGSCEVEKYGDRLNRPMLDLFGSIVYEDPDTGTCIYEIYH